MAGTVECRYCPAEIVIASDGTVMGPALGKCPNGWDNEHHADAVIRETTLMDVATAINHGVFEDDGVSIGKFDVEPPSLHGIVVHHHSNRKPKVTFTYTRAYRNDTLVPFVTYYHDTRMVETF